MISLITLSQNKITKVSSSIRFHFQKTFYWFYILFRTDRELIEIKFNYYKNWHFSNAYLVIQFEFKNAIWIDIEGSKRIYNHSPIILNLEKLDKIFFEFCVYGFGCKRKYQIGINKEAQIDNYDFKVGTHQIKNIFLQNQDIKQNIARAILLNQNTQISPHKITVSHKNLELNHTKFKLQDYL